MIEQVNTLGRAWWDWMWPMFWQVGALILVIGAIDMLLRKRLWPQIRYGLWLLVIVKLVLPPTFALPTGIVSHVRPWAERRLEQSLFSPGSTRAGVVAEGPGEEAARPHSALEPTAPTAPLGSIDPVEHSTPVPAGPGGAMPDHPPCAWQVILMAAWLAGVLAVGSWSIVRFRRIGRLTGEDLRRDDTTAALVGSLAAAAGKLHLRRVPRIVLSGKVCSPSVIGPLRPVLLMPAHGVERLSPQEAEHILLHELAHIKRGDLLIQALCLLVQVFYWFNPFLWFVQRRLQHLRETCCDATVARILKDADAYRQTILETAHRLLAKPGRCGVGLLGLVEDRSRLLSRLRSLEREPRPHGTARRAATFMTVALFLACVLPMAAATPPVRTHIALLAAAETNAEQVVAFDDFDGKLALDWDIVYPDPSHYSLTKMPGTLTITTQIGHFKEGSTDYRNLFLIDTPDTADQDFQVTTCLLGFRPLEAYNQAGLICWDDEDHYLEWIFQKMRQRGFMFAAGMEAAGPTRYDYIPADEPQAKLWLRITKRGDAYACASSTDGESFTVQTVQNWGDGSPKRIGLFAISGSLTHPPEVDASFDFFEVCSAPAGPLPVPSAIRPPSPATETLPVPGDVEKVFEGRYLHRSRGHDYMQATLAKCIGKDGTLLYLLSTRDTEYQLAIGKEGLPERYQYASESRDYSGEFQFSEGQAVWERKMPQREDAETFDWRVSEGALPDLNSRPDPYLIQHVLLQSYDQGAGGEQRFTVYDIDSRGTGINEYEIALMLVDEDGVTLPNGRFKAKHFVQVQQTASYTWYKKGPGSRTEYWVDDDLNILRIFRHREPYEVILENYGAVPLPGPVPPAAPAGPFEIPEANRRIPEALKPCAVNLQAIYAALKAYEVDRGRMPDWLCELVPDYLEAEVLYCPADPAHTTRYWRDPNLPCSYCYELNPSELRSRPPLDKTMRHYKLAQRRLFGDVVPIVRCFHHGTALNLAWDGVLYTSPIYYERLFIPDYHHGMLPTSETVE